MNFTLFCHLQDGPFSWSIQSYFSQFSYVAKQYGMSPLDNRLRESITFISGTLLFNHLTSHYLKCTLCTVHSS